MDVFKADFDAWNTSSAATGLHAAFAFPDPAEPDLLHIVFWSSGDLLEAGPLASAAYTATADDPDTLNTYGSGQVKSVGTGVQLNENVALAGFIRAGHPDPDAAPGSSGGGLPMIGVFRRGIKPGRLDELASSFQVVCDIWHSAVPGILAASVSRDPEDENFVHDIRVFADKASYAAHVDKSNAELTKAMEVWFDNYDTSIPHEGALYAEDTNDPSMRTSSIKDRPVKVAFNQFHYGLGGMVGTVAAVPAAEETVTPQEVGGVGM
mmetsp:Transcript_23133/g.61790  ORF Transcript_23133/g.61790 Transcript_23133/m.61790 type:complete len:265 (-) Transcript_23133:1300-2094(-)